MHNSHRREILMPKGIWRATMVAAVTLAWVYPVVADETGLDGLHEKRREGRLYCFTDHFHDGYGSERDKKKAEAAAIKDWREFTTGEYGTTWGSYLSAASKKMVCESADGVWSCHFMARPCRK
jgi:hypothetical protein